MKKLLYTALLILSTISCTQSFGLSKEIDCKTSEDPICCPERVKCKTAGDLSSCKLVFDVKPNKHFQGDMSLVGQSKVYKNETYFLNAIEAPLEDTEVKGWCQYMYKPLDGSPYSYIRIAFGRKDGIKEPLIADITPRNPYRYLWSVSADKKKAGCVVRFLTEPPFIRPYECQLEIKDLNNNEN